LRERDQVDIGFFLEPFAVYDDVFVKIAEMRDGAAEARQAEP